MVLRILLTSTTASLALSASLSAATVTLNISGTTDDSRGTLTYSPASAFTAKLTFDDAFADQSASPDIGQFHNFLTGGTALSGFELTTELGTVSYDVSAVNQSSPTFAYVAPQVQQIDFSASDTERLGVVSHGGGDALQNGWTGALGSLIANNFSLVLAAEGPDDYFFTDPNSLFSGADGDLSDTPVFVGGQITVDHFGGFDTTTLFFGAGEFSIEGGDGDVDDPLAPVPLPASLSLMALGMAGLGWAARRKGGAA